MFWVKIPGIENRYLKALDIRAIINEVIKVCYKFTLSKGSFLGILSPN